MTSHTAFTESALRGAAVKIFTAGLRAADPEQAVLRHVRLKDNLLIAGKRRYRLDRIDRIFVIGAGKASAVMARPVERLLGRRIAGGWINVKYGHGARLRRIHVHECGHPVPDEAGVEGAEEIARIARGAGAGDLVIALISGGASALMPAPAPGITLAEKQATTRLLLECGATIHEINAVRKHISTIKGGQLGALAWPAQTLAILLSDVIGDNLDVIGSGPVTGDPTTFGDAWSLLEGYGIIDRVPASVRERLDDGRKGDLPETPEPGSEQLARVYPLIAGSNRLAVDAAQQKARELGFRTLVLSTLIEGETREVAKVHAAIAREAVESGRPARPPLCLISGGETTVTLRGKGLGGRNQEFCLAAAIEIDGIGPAPVVILSAGTDGSDGPTDAAGAVIDGGTVARARELGLNARVFLDNNDSYSFFSRTGELLKTGPTRTNVMDVRLLLVGRPR